MDDSSLLKRNPVVHSTVPTPAALRPRLAHSGRLSPVTPETQTPAALPGNLTHLPSPQHRPHSPPGPPRPSAEPCSPQLPWLRHLRGFPAPRTARDTHPHLATAWSAGSRLTSPGTSRHCPSLSAGVGAGAMVAKRRKPGGKAQEPKPQVPASNAPIRPEQPRLTTE